MDKQELDNLVTAMQEGRMESFNRFYEETKRAVYSAAYQILLNADKTEDVLQDTYLKFLKNLKKIKPDKSVVSYLMKIAENEALNLLKKEKRMKHGVDMSLLPDEDPPQEDTHVYEVMGKVLSPTESQIVLLHAVEEKTHKEIAILLNKPLGTITWTYNNAIKKLKKALKKDGY